MNSIFAGNAVSFTVFLPEAYLAASPSARFHLFFLDFFFFFGLADFGLFTRRFFGFFLGFALSGKVSPSPRIVDSTISICFRSRIPFSFPETKTRRGGYFEE